MSSSDLNNKPNQIKVSSGLNLLLPVVSKFVRVNLKNHYGEGWWTQGVYAVLSDIQKKNLPYNKSEDEKFDSLDIAAVLRVFDKNWMEVFAPMTKENPPKIPWCLNWIKELSDYRTVISHAGLNDIPQREAERALDSMYRLCECIDAEAAKPIDHLYMEVRNSQNEAPSLAMDSQQSSGDGTFFDVMPVLPGRSTEITPIAIDVYDLVDAFEGRIVRKDLTKLIKEGANVPIFVLEYLLGTYCSSEDEDEIAEGLELVKDRLSRYYIRPDEAERIKSNIREAGEGYTIIDKVEVSLDYKKDIYVARFLSLGLTNVPIERDMVVENPRLLSGGIWCMITFDYSYIGEDKILNPFKITRLFPIQMSLIDIDDYISQRRKFTKDQWIGLMLRSTGIEPNTIDNRTRMLLLARMMALVENNINICELGPRSTGKSHIYKEISPSSILVSGGQTTVASLFYNKSTHTPGLVCNWDVVAFDEVAEIRFKDKDAIAILKDYMNSGSFSRGSEQLEWKASMVFVGNMNEDIFTLLLQASLFKPFPEGMNEDTAFLDRFHCYIPGWEIEPFSPKSFTDDYGFICDYFAEIARELRKKQFSSVIDQYFSLDESLKQRDVTSIRKMVSAMMKLIYPDGVVGKEGVREILEFAMEMRSRVKEQLKRIQPDDEFIGARFIYHDLETGESKEVLVPECVELALRQGTE